MTTILNQISFASVVSLVIAGLLCGSLGPYLVWKRLGLLGDTIAHASLAVVAAALLLNLPSTPVLIVFAAVLGFLLSLIQEKKFSELDSVLAVLFAGFMGLGLLIMHFSGKGSEEVLHVLFGDASGAGLVDVVILAVLTVVTLAYLIRFRKELQLMLLQPELAQIEGINTKAHSTRLLVLCAVTVAVCLKLMGVVLVTSLFVAPALTALAFSRSAYQHAAFSIFTGVAIVALGLTAASTFALPVSATIAVMGLIVFLGASVFRRA